ncbi:MAG: hypothetical protein U9N62_03530 [Thermotogota bacterium]|nr:hypothetical protein [Thermotogota bacterium]
MNESLYIQENGNFNCRQCEIIVDVDHSFPNPKSKKNLKKKPGL